MIYTARRRELGFDVYELDEPVLFFFRFIQTLQSFLRLCSCQSIKADASKEGGEMINISRKQLSETERVPVVTPET